MRLTCVGRYRSSAGEYSPGQVVDVRDEVGEFLLRDSPSSFRLAEEETPAESQTATGIAAHDRRQRGGSIR